MLFLNPNIIAMYLLVLLNTFNLIISHFHCYCNIFAPFFSSELSFCFLLLIKKFPYSVTVQIWMVPCVIFLFMRNLLMSCSEFVDLEPIVVGA